MNEVDATIPLQNGEQKKDNDQFSIDITPRPDGSIAIVAGITGEKYRYPPPREFKPYVYSEEVLAEMDEEERAEVEAYDPESEYTQKMEKLTDGENSAAIKEQCDLLANALSEVKDHSRLPETAKQAFSLLSSFVGRVSSDATPDMYARLPEKTRRLVEYADRLIQLEHICTGSTYTTPMDRLYSKKEAEACVEDFCRGAEDGLSRGLSTPTKEYAVKIKRPEHVRFTNAVSNLTYAIVKRMGADEAQEQRAWDAMFNGAVHTLTDAYRPSER